MYSTQAMGMASKKLGVACWYNLHMRLKDKDYVLSLLTNTEKDNVKYEKSRRSI